MPFADIVESSIVVTPFSKERAKAPDGVLDPSYERRERATAMHGHLPNNKEVWTGVLAHQNSADLTPTSLPKSRQQQLMLLR